MRQNYSFSKNGNALLEPCEGKLSCTVLRGESPSNGADLLDKEDCQHDDTGRLLELMGEESQRNVMANVSAYIRRREAEDCRMEHVFPELTPSERDICRLVLQDKKLGEICFLLKKSETNINSTRAHIRKKLGLQPSDRLDKALKERMKAAKGK